MKKQFAENLIDYIYDSPTAFNAVETSKDLLLKNGFNELKMNEKWKLKVGGKYFITKNSSSLTAFVINSDNIQDGFRIIGSHSDSPTFRIKPNAEMTVENAYLKLNTESYGGRY
ncbi:putative M18 family aminopeptidase 2 [Terrisporobacter petrolearius]